MRAAVASSARESRGERTLMGIGPEFIRRERAANDQANDRTNDQDDSLDCVPTERMDRTPSAPIVVEQQTARPAPTVRVPIGTTARTVQLSVAPPTTVSLPLEDAAAAPGRSRRLDSVISSGFFQEGERQEANGWEDSPLALEPPADEAPPAFSSFDRIPRKRAPLVVTTFILGIALVIGFAVTGVGARSWIATEAGQRAAQVLNRARSGLTIRLTPESTVASTRAMVSPVAAPMPTPVPPPVSVAAAPVPAVPVAAAPAAEAQPRRPLAARPAPARTAAPPVVAVARRQDPTNDPIDQTNDRKSGDSIAPSSVEKEGIAVAAPVEARAIETPERRVVEPARRGVVWSPSEQRLVPAQQAADESPPAGIDPASDTTRPAGDTKKPSADTDKTVLPLDDEAHTTL